MSIFWMLQVAEPFLPKTIETKKLVIKEAKFDDFLGIRCVPGMRFFLACDCFVVCDFVGHSWYNFLSAIMFWYAILAWYTFLFYSMWSVQDWGVRTWPDPQARNLGITLSPLITVEASKRSMSRPALQQKTTVNEKAKQRLNFNPYSHTVVTLFSTLGYFSMFPLPGLGQHLPHFLDGQTLVRGRNSSLADPSENK